MNMEQQTQLSDRAPCPDRILEDAGGAFMMGSVGGFVWHFFKGMRNSPRGYRLGGAFQAARMNSPRVGGGFAAWGGIFSVTDCAIVYLRRKEDPWNSIMAGAATGGLLSMRQGLGAVFMGSLFGGCALAAMEGGMVAYARLEAQLKQQQLEQQQASNGNVFLTHPDDHMGAAIPDQVSAPSSSWFSSRIKGLFGKDDDAGAGGSGIKTEILESDAPPLPTFDFK